MPGESQRLARERRTVEAMIRLYCRERHGQPNENCVECQRLLDYATERLRKCPFGDGKTTCARCPVHCYRAEMRERVRVVMRYSGPRMLRRQPYLAVHHLMDGLRRRPRRR